MDILSQLGMTGMGDAAAQQTKDQEDDRRKKLLQNPDMDSSGVPMTAIQALFGTPSPRIGGQ